MPFDQDTAAQLERLQFSLQAAGIGTWELDPVHQLIQWDTYCRSLFGIVGTDTVPYEQLLQHIHPNDQPEVSKAIADALTLHSSGQFDHQFRIVGARGELSRWVRLTGQSYFNEVGEPYRFAGVAQEVTQEVAGRYQRHQLNLLVENAPEFMATTDLEGRMQFINGYGLDLFGLKPDQVTTRLLTDFVPPEEMDRVNTEILPSVMRGKWSGTIVLMQPDTKQRIPVVCDAFLLIDLTSGQPYGIAGIVRDRRSELAAQQALVESETRFRSIIEQMPVPILVLRGNDYLIDQINKSMLALMGQEKSVIGKPILAIMPELEGEFVWQQVQKVYQEGISYDGVEVLVSHSTAGLINDHYYNIAYRPFREENQITGMIQVVNDVTEQVRTRQKIEESETKYRNLSAELDQQVQKRTRELALMNEKLIANNEEYAAINEELEESNELLVRSNDNLQRFAYVASHDLQEPLRKVQQFGDLLKNQYADQLGAGVDYIERMQLAANRMSTLIRDLLSFSRISTQQERSELVPLSLVVQTVVNELDLVIEEVGAVVEIEALPTILGDKSQLEQLFQNLVSNALKFRLANTRPRVRVSVQTLLVKHLPTSVKPTRTAPAYHRIDIADNGIGFDEKYVDRIFQVFQRLHGKSAFAGTGIGLAICEKVVANHGGAITASSQPGKGATFSVYLPV